jgi:uncharacterized protein (TIGR02217 family)
MTFAPRFPPTLSLGATGGLGWHTSLTETALGEEYRAAGWGTPLGRWVVGKNLQKGAERDALLAFHRVFAGQAKAFRFKDWTDFQVLSGEGGLVSLFGGFNFLAKNYTLIDVFGNPLIVTRWIHKPVFGTIVFSDGAVVADYEKGYVTGGDLGSSTWVGEFDIPARFEEDRPDIAVNLTADTAGWKGITLCEVRESFE